MSKGSERLFAALSDIDEEKIDQAAPAEEKGVHWRRWAALAAALVLVLGMGAYILPRLGGSAGTPGSSTGGEGMDGASTFMSYAGPVFPLTLKEAEGALTAQREICLDFAPWVKEDGSYRSSTHIQVTDAYTLTNTSAEEKTVSLLYPFVATFRDLAEQRPTLTLDGTGLDPLLHAGGYSGGFEGAWGSEEVGSLNLAQLDSWEQYKALLSDGTYLEKALGDWPDLSATPVTVYKFTDAYAPEVTDTDKVPNPTIRADFDLDYDKTTVLSYGFHGARFDPEGKHMIQSFSIREPGSPGYGEPYFLIVIGEDIRGLTTAGYVTGGTDEDTKVLDGCGVTVERYESDLESALREAAGLMYSWGRREEEAQADADFALYFGLMKEFLCSYGPLSENGVDRYDTGWLEELDFAGVKRVFYLEAEVTIPAGGSIRLSAEMIREGSYDFYCAHTEAQGVYGYDMVTQLGSNLTCTGQTAVLEDRGQIEIVRQNFGFDLEQGITRVALEGDQEHYYLEVRRRADQPEE